MCVDINTGVEYALKVQNKKKIDEMQWNEKTETLKYARAEQNILERSMHPFIVRLKESFQNKKNLFLVLEYCGCGNFRRVLNKCGNRLSEDTARRYICEIILAIEYLHSKGIMYRDLKPDNILVNYDGHLKLADFGLSKECTQETYESKSPVGSYAYLAPEVLN